MKQIDHNTFEVDRPEWPDFINNRRPDSHKGDYGHALLVAGSYGKMGAAILAARACLRCGVGLLTVHVPKNGVNIMQTAVPEAMVSIDEDSEHWTHLFTPEEIGRYDAIAVGPGLGTQSGEQLRQLLASAPNKPMVIDADGLNMLSRMSDKLELLTRHGHDAPTILTPHAKEFERLFGTSQTPDDRLHAQREISRQTGCIVAYKGHRTQTTGQQGEVYINTTGNPGMATAGSGDVLTGIICAIIAQNKENQLNAEKCTIVGVWIHGKSGDLFVEKGSFCSLTAGDIVKNLQYATNY